MVATAHHLRDAFAGRHPSWREVRHAFTDAALMFSLLSGGCMAERPQPDDDDDDCSDEACPEGFAGSGPEPGGEQELPPPTSPDEIPGSSSGACCSPHGGLGCQEHAVESCVCGLDPKCCTNGWDATCVMAAEQLCQRSCGGDGPWG